MSRTHSILAIVLATAVILIGSARWTLRAQDRPDTADSSGASKVVVEPRPEADSRLTRAPIAVPVQEALLRPHTLPFASETTLEDVAAHFRKALNAPVVLDLAALKRQNLTPEATVRLQLESVRLQTVLKLLLDQVGLTYRIIPEDNLLILTDAIGSEDRQQRILDELKSLHRDVHDLQDAVEELSGLIAPEEGDAPSVRKPTMIEEVPGDARAKPEPVATPKGRPGL